MTLGKGAAYLICQPFPYLLQGISVFTFKRTPFFRMFVLKTPRLQKEKERMVKKTKQNLLHTEVNGHRRVPPVCNRSPVLIAARTWRWPSLLRPLLN